MSLPRWVYWCVAGCILLAVLAPVPTWRSATIAEAMAAQNARDSTQRVRYKARWSMDVLLHAQTKPYRDWDEVDRGHYQALRNVCREVGEDCPEVPQ